MSKPLLLAVALATLAAAAQTQTQALAAEPPKFIPRARGPATALAVEGAMAALAACVEKYKAQDTALIADSAGGTVALIGNDGAPLKSQEVAASKVATVIKYKMSSGAVLAKTLTDPALAAAIKADPKIEVARGGGIPIMVGGEMIGVFAIAGTPLGGDRDESCAQVGLDKIQSRLK